MKMQAGANTPGASDAGRGGDQGPVRGDHARGRRDAGDPLAAWLRGTFDKIILDHRPRVPGWGLLMPNQIVGEYAADDGYLLLVFDHRGRPHTRRFSPTEISHLQTDSSQAAAQLKSLIESFCSDA